MVWTMRMTMLFFLGERQPEWAGEKEEGKEGEILTPGCGIYFSLQILVRNEVLVTQSSPTLKPHELDGAHQAPLSTGFSRRESWDGLSFLSPGDLTDPGIEPQSPALQTDSLLSEAPGKPLFLAKQDLHFKFLLLVWLIGSYCLAMVPRPGTLILSWGSRGSSSALWPRSNLWVSISSSINGKVGPKGPGEPFQIHKRQSMQREWVPDGSDFSGLGGLGQTE